MTLSTTRVASLMALLAVAAASGCFSIRDFENGVLACDDGKCPPGMECRLPEDRCYRTGAVAIDAPLPFDASVVDGSPFDGGAVDARRNDAPIFDAPIFDAPLAIFDASPCTQGDRRCVAGNLEICQSGSFVPALPSCADQSQQCFDPGAPGGSDAYCGTCLKGAERCSSAERQTCPATGIWSNAGSCTPFLCFDPDGADGPMSYCGECTDGQKRCSGGLQTCVLGRWSAPEDCAATSGWSCFDPAPPGGSDAYCGLCLKGVAQCRGDNVDVCNAQGTGFTTVQGCSWGCEASSVTCCAEPDCGGRVCGSAPSNACGRTQACGAGCNGPCCNDGMRCCGSNQDCCGTACCGPLSTCCDDVCQSGPC